MKKRRKKKTNKILSYGLIGLVLIAIIAGIAIYFSENSQFRRAMKVEGYNTGSDDPFYRKIVTGNTLDDYYAALANEQNTQYLEYYIDKEAYSFMEEKLTYQNNVATTLKIGSDLRDLSVMFNYELSYKEAYLLMEGNSNNNYQCEVIMSKEISQEAIHKYCRMVQQEIEDFNVERDKLLTNQKIQDILKDATTKIQGGYDEE